MIASSSADSSLRTLVAFSAARSFSINSANPIDLVIPIFQPIATERHGRVFDAEDLSHALAERYDLLVSRETCEYWCTQLIKKGMIVPADRVVPNIYVWNQSNSINAPVGSFEIELAEILEKFRAFLGAAEDLISSAYDDERLYDVLRKGAVGSLFPKLYASSAGGFRSDEQYIFSRFVTALRVENSPILDSIVKLRRAAIVCDLILHVQAPKPPPANSQPVSVYLDAPLVMDIIGLSGKQRQEFSSKLLSGFEKLNLVPFINPDMVFEIKNNVGALLRTEPAKRFGPTADAIRNRDLKLSFVEAAADRIEPMIEGAGIKVDNNLPALVKRSVVTDDLEASLFSKLQSHYNSPDAALRDARAVRSVLGRRGELRPTGLYNSRALFITGNEMVARISNRFFRENIGYSDSNFPVVLSRATLAAITDSILGIQSAGSMTLQELLISAADVTQYDPDVLLEIERRLGEISPDEVTELTGLLSRTDYSQLVMDMAKGNPRNITTANVQALIGTVRTRVEREAEARVAASRQRERADAQARADILSRELATKDAALQWAITELRTRHEEAQKLAKEWIDNTEAQRRLVATLSAVAGFITALVVGMVAYAAIDFAHALEDNDFARLGTSILIGVATGVPFAGFPPVREQIQRLLATRNWKKLDSQLRSRGYVLQSDLPQSILADMDKQFDAKLAEMKGGDAGQAGALLNE